MITVFYANTVYGQYEIVSKFREAVNMAECPEVYNGAFIHTDIPYWHMFHLPGWYRADGTPYPEDQIDGRMKAWLLLMD